MKPRRAGEYRTFVVVQEQVETSTTTGFTKDWVPVVEGWAKVEPAQAAANKRQVGETTDAPTTHLVTLDYHERLAPKQRVMLEGGRRFLYVVGAPQDLEERHVTTLLSCEEREERAA